RQTPTACPGGWSAGLTTSRSGGSASPVGPLSAQTDGGRVRRTERFALIAGVDALRGIVAARFALAGRPVRPNALPALGFALRREPLSFRVLRLVGRLVLPNALLRRTLCPRAARP